MRQYEFDAPRWSRIKNTETLMECVVTSRRTGWLHAGYEVRLFCRGQLVYSSRLYLTRKLANDEADALLHDAIRTVSCNTRTTKARSEASNAEPTGAIISSSRLQPSH